MYNNIVVKIHFPCMLLVNALGHTIGGCIYVALEVVAVP